MLEPLGNLIRRWRTDPRPATTLALCQGLAEAGEAHRRTPPRDWADFAGVCAEVGRHVARHLALDLDVLLAAGRMHLAAGSTWDAQAATLQAAKIAPDEPRAWALLGEALLRRGDAGRALRSLERAKAAGVPVEDRLIELAERMSARLDAPRDAVADAVAMALGYAAQPPPPGMPSLPPGPVSTPPPPAVAQPRGASGLPVAPGADELGEATVRREMDVGELRALLSAAEDLGREGVSSVDDPRALEALARLRGSQGRGDFDDSMTSQVPGPPPPARGPIHSDAFTLVRPQVDDDTTTETSARTAVGAMPRGPGEAEPATVLGRVPQELLAQLRDLERAQVHEAPRAPTPSLDEAVPTVARQLAPRSQDAAHHPMIEDATTERRFLDEPSAEDVIPTLNLKHGMMPLPRGRVPEPAPDARVIVASPPREPTMPLPQHLPRALPAPPPPSRPAPPPPPPPPYPSSAGPKLPGLLEDVSHSGARPLPPATSSSPTDPRESKREPRRRPRGRRVLGWLLAIAVLGAGGAIVARERGIFRGEGARAEASAAIARARDALLRGDLPTARKLVAEVAAAAPADAGVSRLALDVAVVDVLDGAVPPEKAVDVLLGARKRGQTGVELALAALASTVGSRNAEHAQTMLEQHEKDGPYADDGLYQLARGAALDLMGDPRAVEAYQRAREIEPRLASAAVRHVRALVFAGRVADARTAFEGAPVEGASADAIRTLLARADRPDRWPEREARISRDAVGDLPRPLRAIGAALALVPQGTAGSDSMGLDAALDDADAPGALVLCGQLAFSTGDLEAASSAAKRAVELRDGWAPAQALAARALLARGALAEALALESSLPPAVSAELRAIAAYESGDPEALAEAESRAVEKGAARWPALALALSRVRGAGKRPAPADVDGLVAEGVSWADVLAIDLAMDAGDLERAAKVAKGFRAPPDAARSLRLARLRRLEGDLVAARAALGTAGGGRLARIEELLIAADAKDERKKAIAALEAGPDAALGDLTPYALAYLKGREGAFQGASAALARAKRAPDGTLEGRVLRLLGLAAARDTGKAGPLLPLVEALKGRPEVVWAGVMLGALPPNKMPKGMK